MMPPTMIAAQTWRCVRLTGPSHASGETHRAKMMPISHWNAISPANSRSVRSWISRCAAAKIWPARPVTLIAGSGPDAAAGTETVTGASTLFN
jgi:hypothetical protein